MKSRERGSRSQAGRDIHGYSVKIPATMDGSGSNVDGAATSVELPELILFLASLSGGSAAAGYNGADQLKSRMGSASGYGSFGAV